MSGTSAKKPTPLIASTLSMHNPTSPPVRDQAILTVLSGDDTGRVLALPDGETVTLGRGPDCTFRFDDITISVEHGQFARSGDRVSFRDLGSKNGSTLNDVEVAEGPLLLHDGDRLRFGPNLVLRYTLVDELERAALQQLHEAALRDGLTGIFNRKYLDQRLTSEIGFAERHGSQLSIILLDLDHFKRVNDEQGHLAGDAVLRQMSALLLRELRDEDVLARFGGEEFVVVLRAVGGAEAVALAERLLAVVKNATVHLPQSPVRITASAGVATLACCTAAPDGDKLMAIADSRLYAAKNAGRNRVVGP